MYDMESFYQATSIADAVSALVRTENPVILAGGTDVLIQMREGKLAGRNVVSIFGIPELRGVSIDEEGTIRIRPLTVFSELTGSPIVQKHLPMLGYAADQVGGPQIRNMGTAGGNISNGVTIPHRASSAITRLSKLPARMECGWFPCRSFTSPPERWYYKKASW